MTERPGSIDTQMMKLLDPEASAADSSEAWELWEKHPEGGQKVWQFIRTRNFSPELPDDIYQDTVLITMLAIRDGAYTHRSWAGFAAYMRRIALNRMCIAQRERHAQLPIEAVAGRRSEPGRPLEEEALVGVECDALDDELEKMTDLRQWAVRLWANGWPYAEIAHTLGVSEQSARKHVSRGLRELRKLGRFSSDESE